MSAKSRVAAWSLEEISLDGNTVSLKDEGEKSEPDSEDSETRQKTEEEIGGTEEVTTKVSPPSKFKIGMMGGLVILLFLVAVALVAGVLDAGRYLFLPSRVLDSRTTYCPQLCTFQFSLSTAVQIRRLPRHQHLLRRRWLPTLLEPRRPPPLQRQPPPAPTLQR